jgi:hypothetical protein
MGKREEIRLTKNKGIEKKKKKKKQRNKTKTKTKKRKNIIIECGRHVWVVGQASRVKKMERKE